MTTFKLTNSTGQTLIVNGQTISSGDYIDLLPLWAFGQIEESENDIEGVNEGTAIDGTKILDIVAEKQNIPFVSQILDHDSCVALKAMAKPKPLTVSTDLFSSDERTYTMYTLVRNLTHISGQYCKVSFTFAEV